MKDFAKTYEQKKWGHAVAQYERNKEHLKKYNEMLAANYTESSKQYIKSRIADIEQQQENFKKKYPNLKWD